MGKVIIKLKCFLSIPIYFFFLLYNKDRKLSLELRAWENALPVVKYKSEFLAFVRMFALFREYRSVLFFRMGALGEFLKLLIPNSSSIHFITNSKNIASGLVLQHGYSTIIWANSIGENCQIWHQVTIGRAKPFGERPIIGNNVKICTGSVVIGKITIGDNVTIGAGSIVTKNIPSNSTVVGNPARIVKQNGISVNLPL